MTIARICGLAAALAAAVSVPATARADIQVTTLAGGAFGGPIDAAFDSDAKRFFFISMEQDGPSVYEGEGAMVTRIAHGAPLMSPSNIAISGDDKHLYVADPGAGMGGEVFVFELGHRGARASGVLAGASGFAPRGLDVRGGHVYFTGVDPMSGAAGVFRVGQHGGHVETVAAGFHDPRTVAVGEGEVVYVADQSAPGQVDIVRAGKHQVWTVLGSDLDGGSPPGIALTRDGGTLVLSGVMNGSDLLYLIDVETGATTTTNQGISQNHSAAGVHRARESNDFAWADLTAGGVGTVYHVTFK